MSGRLISLDKCPGVSPVGVGDTWRQILAKCMMVMTGAEANEVCSAEQLYDGLEAGIEVGIHAVWLLWKQHAQVEDWGFLLIDARNAFNEENHTAMLWAVRHEWPSCAWFAFNCYHHRATLMIRAGNGTVHLLYSKEGATQGYPLAMVAYGMGILPLSENCGRPTPESPSPGMRMTLGRVATLRESVVILIT